MKDKTRSRSELRDYQVDDIEFCVDAMRCGLFNDMGLGKSVSAATAMCDMQDDFKIDNILIIAPLNVATATWPSEFKQWGHLRDRNIVLCRGSVEERKRLLNSDAEVHIINIDLIPWLVANVHWKWDAVIIDESSGFKSSSTKRFKALRKKVPKIKACILLSGTFTPNGMRDLWSQMFIIDSGKRLGRTMRSYMERYFVKSYFGFTYELKDDNSIIKIKDKVKDVVRTRKTSDHIELPDRIDIYERIQLKPKARKIYHEMLSTMVLELKHLDMNNTSIEEIEASTAGVLCNKLLQICNGSIYDEERNIHFVHDEKIKRLRQILNDNPGENIFLAYSFQTDIIALKKEFGDMVVQLTPGAPELEAWNRGEIRILACHPASASHGLNAQYGGSIICWYGINWSLELYRQFNKRLHRSGQTNVVRIIHLIIEDSIDEVVVDALRNKGIEQDIIIDALKAMNKN